jgi:hypothetical protein
MRQSNERIANSHACLHGKLLSLAHNLRPDPGPTALKYVTCAKLYIKVGWHYAQLSSFLSIVSCAALLQPKSGSWSTRPMSPNAERAIHLYASSHGPASRMPRASVGTNHLRGRFGKGHPRSGSLSLHHRVWFAIYIPSALRNKKCPGICRGYVLDQCCFVPSNAELSA